MPADPTFRMTVEDVFFIRGRGTVITGRIEQGVLKVGDEIILNHQGAARQVVVTGVEMFRKVMNQAGPGDNVGVLVKDLAKDDVLKGDVLSGSAGSTSPSGDFTWNFQ